MKRFILGLAVLACTAAPGLTADMKLKAPPPVFSCRE